MREAGSTIRLSQPRRPAIAFTLIEMLVVIFILSILVTLVVGVGNYVYDEAGRKQTQATMAVLANTIDAFHEEFDKYPSDHLSLDDDVELCWYLTGHITVDSADPNSQGAYAWLVGGSPSNQQIIDLNNRITNVTRERLVKLSKDAYASGASSTNAFRDGFGNPIRYNDDAGLGGRPVLISAGPDGLFGWDDPDDSGGFLTPNPDPTKQEDNVRSDEF